MAKPFPAMTLPDSSTSCSGRLLVDSRRRRWQNLEAAKPLIVSR
jgi:hypothetical protein